MMTGKKNLAWPVVEARGQKRMVKRIVNVEKEMIERDRKRRNGGKQCHRQNDNQQPEDNLVGGD